MTADQDLGSDPARKRCYFFQVIENFELIFLMNKSIIGILNLLLRYKSSADSSRIGRGRRHSSQIAGASADICSVTPETLSRFERGRSPEFGARKLLAVLAVLGMELDPVVTGQSGTLDDLRRERNQARS
jgi:HTH-type transcriptional regulator/antitoxin HipB